MVKYKVTYERDREGLSSARAASKEVTADKLVTSEEWLTFVDDSGIVWQVAASRVSEVERLDD